jgi:hypothetical protein
VCEKKDQGCMGGPGIMCPIGRQANVLPGSEGGGTQMGVLNVGSEGIGDVSQYVHA